MKSLAFDTLILAFRTFHIFDQRRVRSMSAADRNVWNCTKEPNVAQSPSTPNSCVCPAL